MQTHTARARCPSFKSLVPSLPFKFPLIGFVTLECLALAVPEAEVLQQEEACETVASFSLASFSFKAKELKLPEIVE